MAPLRGLLDPDREVRVGPAILERPGAKRLSIAEPILMIGFSLECPKTLSKTFQPSLSLPNCEAVVPSMKSKAFPVSS